jgi:hypothetical protein
VEGIPLADDEDTKVTERKAASKVAAPAPGPPTPAASPASTPKSAKEDDAIAEFLLDLNLDDEE